MELRELQRLELDVLKYFDKFCQEHNLKYCLAYGTLLGAVRHKDFIPWDDDVDVYMLREDYERFAELSLKESDERYKVLCLQNTKDYIYPTMKVVDSFYEVVDFGGLLKKQQGLGVWIDIFPLDNYDGKISCKKLLNLTRKHRCTVQVKPYFGGGLASKNFIFKAIKLLAYIIYHNRSSNKYAKKIDELSKKCNKKTGKLFVGQSENPAKSICPAEWFDKVIKLPFWDGEFYCPLNYDEILTKNYGDYMQLPKVEDRVTHKVIVNKIK